MNRIAARLLTHLTSSMRFPGELNVDLNEITTNLVPFPRLHYLMPALAPLDLGGDGARGGGGGGVDSRQRPRAAVVRQLFMDAFSRSHQLIRADPRTGSYLACALLLRGDLSVSDVNNAMAKIQPTINNVHWNDDGFKVGLCGAPPLGSPHGLLCLANNSCIATTFDSMHDRFMRLYSRRAMLHHYTQVRASQGFQGSTKLYKAVCLAQRAANSHRRTRPPSRLASPRLISTSSCFATVHRAVHGRRQRGDIRRSQ